MYFAIAVLPFDVEFGFGPEFVIIVTLLICGLMNVMFCTGGPLFVLLLRKLSAAFGVALKFVKIPVLFNFAGVTRSFIDALFPFTMLPKNY